MSRTERGSTTRRSALAMVLLLTVASAALAGEGEQLRRTVEQTIEVERQTQKKEDGWAARQAELRTRYLALVPEKERLEKTKAAAQTRLNAEAKLVAEAQRRAGGAQWLEQDLQASLEEIVSRLEKTIAADLPFLPDERSRRIAGVRETLANGENSPAEKYRRVMEALQVETEYGRSVEVYQDTVEIEGQKLVLDILRLGRVSLFCRTPDGSITGQYDRASGKYVSLPGTYHREIAKAMEIARKERSTELVRLPLGRIALQ